VSPALPHSLPQHSQHCRSPIVPCTPGTLFCRGSGGRLHSTAQPHHGSPPDIPTSYFKGQMPTDSSLLPFFYGERCLILSTSDDEHCVCVRFKEVLFNCSLLPFLGSHLPMPAFSLGFGGQ
jgi:hypothetical protein